MSFLFVDRIVQFSPGKSVKGIKHVTRDDVYLTTDEQGGICFIPSLIGETLGQLAAWNVMHYHDFSLRPVAGVVGSARLHRPAYLGETLVLESYIDQLDERVVQYHSVAYVGDEPIFTVEGALGPLLPMADFISADEIRSQFAAIYHLDDEYKLGLCSEKGMLGQDPTYTIAPMIFDGILSCEPGVSLVAEKRITAKAAYFRDHFPKKPVLPMTVLLECQLNLAREFVARAGYDQDYHVSELRRIKMNEFVQPGAVLICHVKVKKQTEDELILSCRCEVDSKRVCVVDVVLLSKRC